MVSHAIWKNINTCGFFKDFKFRSSLKNSLVHVFSKLHSKPCIYYWRLGRNGLCKYPYISQYMFHIFSLYYTLHIFFSINYSLKDNGNENFYWLFQSYLTTELWKYYHFLLEHFSLRVKCIQTLCFGQFRRHLGKKIWKIISKVNELCDVIGWVAPKLQERIILRACYVS
jgi:hypothetical protein